MDRVTRGADQERRCIVPAQFDDRRQFNIGRPDRRDNPIGDDERSYLDRRRAVTPTPAEPASDAETLSEDGKALPEWLEELIEVAFDYAAALEHLDSEEEKVEAVTMAREWSNARKKAAAALRARLAAPKGVEPSETERLRAVIERDRSQVAEVLSGVRATFRSYGWLLEGRGPYEWDDDRYKDEAGRAWREVTEKLEALDVLARDWSDCPMTTEEVLAARKLPRAASPSVGERATPVGYVAVGKVVKPYYPEDEIGWRFLGSELSEAPDKLRFEDFADDDHAEYTVCALVPLTPDSPVPAPSGERAEVERYTPQEIVRSLYDAQAEWSVTNPRSLIRSRTSGTKGEG